MMRRPLINPRTGRSFIDEIDEQIAIIEAEGSAEAATSPSHGSNNPLEEDAVNDISYNTEGAEAATDRLNGSCAALDLADRLRFVRDERDRLDAMIDAVPFQNRMAIDGYRFAAVVEYGDEERALLQLLSLRQATSLDGALLQIAQAINIAQDLLDGPPPEGVDTQWLINRRALHRLLFSALAAVETRSDRTLDGMGLGAFASPHLNPWTPPEERVRGFA